MKNTITLFVLIFITTNVSSQIGSTKSKIIKDQKNSSLEITDNGIEYISYKTEYENYSQLTVCYLTKKEDSEEQLCFKVLFMEPSSETNNWVKWMNDENFVKLDGMMWKDYENSILYNIEIIDNYCLVTKYYDEKL